MKRWGHMKKLVKPITITVILVLIALVMMGVADYRRTTQSFEKPLFAQLNTDEAKRDGSSGEYNGIGYSIYIEGNFMPEDEFKGITRAHFYVLGKELRYAIRD